MALTAAQMAQMSRLLDEALDLDPAGRRRWLEQLAPEHQDLAPGLRQVLLPDAGPGVDHGLDTLPKIGGGVYETVISSGLGAGERVGPYQLLRPLGAGGMAEVWLARRADGAFKREVALKLPMLSHLRRDLAQRFAHERDILAGLEHVNIARLYDAGVSDHGLPYLAMEYVPGEPLTAWCDQHRLGVRERIKLFLQVLDAVQYAHARQVIHRDIKPSNILVTESGQVRLLDFGVAKLLEEGEEPQTQLTQLYGRALTPDYASPEHLFGEAASAASDIYSLGVVLFELLTGCRPYRLKAGASLAMLERAIADAQVQPPSTQLAADAGSARATTQAKLVKRLRGDLDAIVLKALARNPQERYDSASALADDLQRHLSGEPVEAQPDTLLYRAGKFALRHRTAIGTSAVAALAVVAAAVLVQSRAPAPAPAPAVNASAAAAALAPEKSIAVLPFADMSEKKDEEYFSDGLAEELLELLSRVPDLHVVARTSAFSFKGSSDDIPTIAKKLRVANVLQGSVRRSGNVLRISAQLVRADSGYQLWSQSYDRKLDDIFKIQDEIAAAVVKELKVSLFQGSMPKAGGTRNTEALTLIMQANALSANSRSRQEYEKINDYIQRSLKIDPSYAYAWALLSNVRLNQANLGWLPFAQGGEEARRAAEQSLALDPTLPAAHSAMTNVFLYHDWNWAAAEVQIQQSLALNPNGAGAFADAAKLYWVLGDVDKATMFQRKAIETDPVDSYAWLELGNMLRIAGKLGEAQEAIHRALDLNPGAAYAHLIAALLLLAKGDPASAMVEIDRESGPENREFGRAIGYHALGRKAEADAALAEYEKNYARTDAYGVAEIHAYRSEIEEAFQWLERAYRQRDFQCAYFVKTDLLFRNLWPDPRFKEFLRKMKLPD